MPGLRSWAWLLVPLSLNPFLCVLGQSFPFLGLSWKRKGLNYVSHKVISLDHHESNHLVSNNLDRIQAGSVVPVMDTELGYNTERTWCSSTRGHHLESWLSVTCWLCGFTVWASVSPSVKYFINSKIPLTIRYRIFYGPLRKKKCCQWDYDTLPVIRCISISEMLKCKSMCIWESVKYGNAYFIGMLW